MQCGFSISLSGFFFFFAAFLYANNCENFFPHPFLLACCGRLLFGLVANPLFFSMPECTYFLFLIKSGSKSWGACPSRGGFSGLGLVSVRFGWVRIG